MPIKNPEEIRNADTVEVDPKKLATKHSDDKFSFPKGEDRDTKESADQGNESVQEDTQ